MTLPVRPHLEPGQALDCYLEHLAEANLLTTAELTNLLRRSGTTRHLTLMPSADTLTSLAEFTGLDSTALLGATLSSFDGGRPLDLSGFDPESQHSFRTVSARGWLMGSGSQLCPACYAETGYWQTSWRLFTTTCCTRHGNYLLTTCPNCNQPFRNHRTALRAVGTEPICGNPCDSPTNQCRQDLTILDAPAASAACLRRQERHDQAIVGQPVTLLGHQVSGAEYLSESRATATLLFHIASHSPKGQPIPWILPTPEEPRRGPRPRWGIRPPHSTHLRSIGLASADHILTATDRHTAAERFAPWAELIPRDQVGPISWATDRTTLTPHLTQALLSALAPSRRLSYLLTTTGPLTATTRHIPQLLPAHLYQDHLAADSNMRPNTARMFAALCLARTHPGISTWAAAAAALRLPPQIGIDLARTASGHLHVSPTTWLSHITKAATHLEPTDYRAREDQIATLPANPQALADFYASRPGTRTTSAAYALTWLWTTYANASIDTSPAAPGPVSRRWRAACIEFARTLTAEQQQRLLACLPQ